MIWVVMEALQRLADEEVGAVVSFDQIFDAVETICCHKSTSAHPGYGPFTKPTSVSSELPSTNPGAQNPVAVAAGDMGATHS